MLRAHFHDAEDDHDDARRLGVFGSATLVFGFGDAAFVKLHSPPSADQAGKVLRAAENIAGLDSVGEIARTTPPAHPSGETG